MKRLALPFMLLSLSLSLVSTSVKAFADETISSKTETKATTSSAKSTAEPWWKHAVFYEIYPRSFADSDNNGIGDIAGITSKLDYLKGLGVDALWITPCYPSPQVDFGYDISDYTSIAPEYGTMQDFDKLMSEAKKRDIKIVMDLVMNHTSDKHPWFIESASSKDNPKRDWYVWRDGKDGGPPNNWQSVFGHSAWTKDPRTGQYYYHFFYAEQPDLNYRNPKVRDAMYNVAKFWLDKGVAGFRLDAICTLFEDPALTNNPITEGKKNKFGDPQMENTHNDNQPEVHEVLRELRKVVDSYPGDRMLIGETGAHSMAELATLYGKNHDEINLPMNFFIADINKLSAPDFRARIAEWDKNPAEGWPLYFFSNHDQTRHPLRYGDPKDSDQVAKLTSAMLLTLRGSPILYYGEELGMENKDPKRVEEVKDPIGRVGWPEEKGRDGERTPMQWTADKNAGFSTATPWLPVTDSYKTRNVQVEEKDPHSVLTWYKNLLELRKSHPALVSGSYVTVNPEDKNVLTYVRKNPSGKSVLVSLNMSNAPQTVHVDAKATGMTSSQAKTLMATDKAVPSVASLEGLTLAPYGVYIGELD